MSTGTEGNLSGERIRELISSARREAAGLDLPEVPAVPVGAIIPHHELIAEIGRGGMGVVYLARQETTRRTVAIKVMLAGSFASLATRRRFQREIELAARLQHPGIVRVLESGVTSQGQPYFAMDHIEGVTLSAWRLAAQPDTRTVLRLFTRICDAVAHAHEHDVVHRDLKPANVLIDDQNEPHVLDFGLAKATDRHDLDATLTLTVSTPGQVLGTLGYLSPEQAAGLVEDIDDRTDVYALGVMLFETLAGNLPVDTSGTPSEITRRIQEEPPHSLTTLTPRIDKDIETIVLKALEKEPRRRYQSIGELRDDIERYLNGEPIHARPPSTLYVMRKKVRKHRRTLTLAALIPILCLLTLWIAATWRAHHLTQTQAQRRAEVRRHIVNAQYAIESHQTPYDNVLGSIKSDLAVFPDLPEAQLALAHVNFRLGQERNNEQIINYAISLLRDAVNRESPHVWAHRALLNQMLEVGGMQPAAQRASLADLHVPETAENWHLYSFTTFDPAQAITCARQACDLDPEFTLARIRLAQLYGQTRQIDAMQREIDTLVAQGDPPLMWHRFEARILLRVGRYTQAIESYTRAIQIEPERTDYLYRGRALAQQCLGNHTAAIEDFTLAKQPSSPRIPWERYYRATSLWALGRYEEAAADYEAASAMQSSVSFSQVRHVLVLHDWARSLAAAGKLDRAEQITADACEELARLRVNVKSAWIEAILDCLAGELPPAELARRGAAGSPAQRCEGCYYAAEAYLLRGRVEDARRLFQKCVETNLPLDPGPTLVAPMCEYHLALWRLSSLPSDNAGGDTP